MRNALAILFLLTTSSIVHAGEKPVFVRTEPGPICHTAEEVTDYLAWKTKFNNFKTSGHLWLPGCKEVPHSMVWVLKDFEFHVYYGQLLIIGTVHLLGSDELKTGIIKRISIGLGEGA